MRAVVMAGGQGTRMLPYTTVLPKPLLPVGDRPILAILLEQLAACGVDHIDLCLGYLGRLIRAYLEDAPPALRNATLTIHAESEPLGTVGALRTIPDLDGSFLVLNGDVLTTLDFAAVMRTHHDTGAALTVVGRVDEVTIPWGVLKHDGDTVTAWVEKPVLRHLVSLGIYGVDAAAVDLLAPGAADVPDLANALLRARRPVRVHRFDGHWFDIGTPEQHASAAADFASHPERYAPMTARDDRGGTSSGDEAA